MMPGALSTDLRERIVAAYNAGLGTYGEVAELFGVGPATVNRLLSRLRSTGSVVASPRGGGNPPRIRDEDLPALQELVRMHSDATLAELCALWKATYDVPVGISTMSRALRAADFTRKKSSSKQPSSSGQTWSRAARSSRPGSRRPTSQS
jgi:transposase